MYLVCTGIYKDDRTNLYFNNVNHLQISKFIEGSWFKEYYKDIITEGVTGYKLKSYINGHKLTIQYLESNSYEETTIYLEELYSI